METVVLIVAALIVALVAWDYWRISQPLTEVQISLLAAKRRSRLIYENYCFTRRSIPLDTAFKRSMRPDGSFHCLDFPLDLALSMAASHLKYKKHEWVIFLIRGFRQMGRRSSTHTCRRRGRSRLGLVGRG